MMSDDDNNGARLILIAGKRRDYDRKLDKIIINVYLNERTLMK